MKRRELILATSGIVGGFALGCSDGMSSTGGVGGTPGSGGTPATGGIPGSGGSTGGTGDTGGSGGTGDSGGTSSGGTNTGGSNTGGSNTGGSNTGGSNTGGSNTGGSNTGGGNSGGSGGGSSGPVTCESMDGNTNHQHPLEVTNEMIEAGVQITLTAGLDAGAFPHEHPVTITAAMWTMLKNTGTLMVNADDDEPGHIHLFTITCE